MHRYSENKASSVSKPLTSSKKIPKRTSTAHHSRNVSSTIPSRPETSGLNAQISRLSFNFQYPIGRGGFGKVWKVEFKKTKTLYALKEMQKLRVISKRSVHSVMNEREILESLRCNFIVNMHFAFQDRENLFLALDLKNGGDLRYHIAKVKKFTELQAKFFICCIVLGLQFIHSNNVIHRDIKPENLVLDEKGYLFITDFGIARRWVPDNSKDTSGTPGYMAPEVIFRQNHTFAADYFAVGVILYELIMRKRPYIGRDRKEIRDQILSKQARITEVPENWSLEAADFANKMIQRKVSSRLGNNGFSEVCQHPWVRDFPWRELYAGTLQSPFVPRASDNFDPRNLGDWKDEIDPTIDLNGNQALFAGYTYDERIFMTVQNGHHKKSVSLV